MAKKRKAFGGYHIVPDQHLAKIIGKGKVSPAEMTKRLWRYVKKNRLARKR